MHEVIKNIIPRLENYSQKLKKKEQLVDKAWHLLFDGYTLEYIFTRAGEAYRTIPGGFVEKGSWKILDGTNQLYIEFPEERLMLKCIFIDASLMIFSISGLANYYLFFDISNIKKNEIEGYLKLISSGKISVSTREKSNDLYIYITTILFFGLFIFLLSRLK